MRGNLRSGSIIIRSDHDDKLSCAPARVQVQSTNTYNSSLAHRIRPLLNKSGGEMPLSMKAAMPVQHFSLPFFDPEQR